MTRYRCLTCEGEYEDSDEGYSYYHVCPIYLGTDSQGKPIPLQNRRNENIVLDVPAQWETVVRPAGEMQRRKWHIIAAGNGRVEIP